MKQEQMFKAVCKCGQDTVVNLPDEQAAQEYVAHIMGKMAEIPTVDMSRHGYSILPQQPGD